jgi:hypothetical protein
MPLSSHVSTASGQKMLVAEGTRLVFGRGPGVDLIVAAGRGLSRRAGLVTVMAAGVWIANISRTHALYVEGEGYQVRLPRMEHDGEPANGWFVHAGTALVGSRAMLDEGQSLMVTVIGQYEAPTAGDQAGYAEDTELAATGLKGGRLAATGLIDEGEWTDEVFAAGPAGQADVEGGSRGGAVLTGAGQGARAAAKGSGPGHARPSHADPGPAGPGPAGLGRAGSGHAGSGHAGSGHAGSGHAGSGHAGSGRAGPGYGGSSHAGPDPSAAQDGAGEPDGPGLGARDGDGTLLPFYLDPMTKLFLVALIWCRPWLDDPSAAKPLPRTPEIARGALEVTGAYHELERFDADPEYRDLLSARVAEHIKVLRRKIADRGLAAADVRISDEVAVRILIEHGIITSADLSRLDDPAWRSRQEDLWWTQG